VRRGAGDEGEVECAIRFEAEAKAADVVQHDALAG
jgi:hypothetical protein